MPKAIPILRIFQLDLALAFYRDWLGFQVDWEHRHEPGFPVYMQVSRGDLVFHLTEHSGDCSPGAKVFIDYPDLHALHAELQSRPYAANRPGLQKMPWGIEVMSLTDPFSNRLDFSRRL